MLQLLYTIHISLCVGLVFLVLLQHGKGADMGAAFGGNSNTVFGAGGAPDFLTKLTTGIAVAFMFTSVLLVRGYEQSAHAPAGQVDPLSGSVMEGVQKPVENKKPEALPAVEGAGAATDALKKDNTAAAPSAEKAADAKAADAKPADARPEAAASKAEPVAAEAVNAPAPAKDSADAKPAGEEPKSGQK